MLRSLVKEYSGGNGKPIPGMIDSYVKTLTCARDTPAEFYRDVVKVNVPHAGWYIGARVMATASAPDNYVKGDKAIVWALKLNKSFFLFRSGDLMELKISWNLQ